ETFALQLFKKAPFEISFGVRQGFCGDAFRAHEHTPPVSHYRPRGALRIECSRVPVAADQRRQRSQRFEVIQDNFHLPPPVCPRAVCVEMNRDGTKPTCRVVDLGDERPQMPEPLFLAPHFVLPVWQRDGMDVPYWVFRKKSETVQRFCILAFREFLNAASLLQG